MCMSFLMESGTHTSSPCRGAVPRVGPTGDQPSPQLCFASSPLGMVWLPDMDSLAATTGRRMAWCLGLMIPACCDVGRRLCWDVGIGGKGWRQGHIM